MKKVAIIACFIGKVHNYFGLWLKSAAANPTIDFWLLGKMNLEDYVLPPNCHVRECTLEELEQLAKVRLNKPDAIIFKPYKTGDYRPMFGEMFEEDFLKGYDVWGYCDIDIVFGNLRKFLTDEKLEQYDKIYPLGHLSFYRNTPEINRRWRLPDARYDIDTVLTAKEVFAFDEWRGIHNIYMRNKFPFYRNVEYASFSPTLHRFRFENRSDARYERNPDNYAHMCFYWEDGAAYRAFNEGDKRHPQIKTEEYVYMHFQQRRFPLPTQEVLDSKAFFCTPDGFFVKERPGVPSLEEMDTYNPLPFGGVLGEKLLLLLASFRRFRRRFIHKHFNVKGSFAKRDKKLHDSRKWS